MGAAAADGSCSCSSECKAWADVTGTHDRLLLMSVAEFAQHSRADALATFTSTLSQKLLLPLPEASGYAKEATRHSVKSIYKIWAGTSECLLFLCIHLGLGYS